MCLSCVWVCFCDGCFLFFSFVICLGCDHSLTLHHLFILTSHYAAWHYIYRHCHGSGSQHSEFLLFLWHFVLWFPEFILLAFVQYVFMCVSLCALFPSSVPVFPSLCVIPYFLHLLCLSVSLDLLVSLSVVSSQSPCHVWILCRPLCLVSLASSLSLPLMLPPVGSCVMFLHFLFYCESLVFPCSVCLVVLPLWRQVHSCQLYSPCVLTSLVILLCIYVPHGCACPRVPGLYNFPV